MPTEEPPQIDIKDANVEVKPPFKSSVPAFVCAAKIVSAGPYHLGSFDRYKMKLTKIEAGIQISKGTKFKLYSPNKIFNSKISLKNKKLNTTLAAYIKIWATKETIIPIKIATNRRAEFSIRLIFFSIFMTLNAWL